MLETKSASGVVYLNGGSFGMNKDRVCSFIDLELSVPKFGQQEDKVQCSAVQQVCELVRGSGAEGGAGGAGGSAARIGVAIKAAATYQWAVPTATGSATGLPVGRRLARGLVVAESATA